MAWCPFKFKITNFLLVGTTKIVIFSSFMLRFCGGVLDVIFISICCHILFCKVIIIIVIIIIIELYTTFSFAAWYVLWVGMWLSLCCFDLAPLVI